MGSDLFRKLFDRGNSYWLTRFVILRLLGFVYAVAFLVAVRLRAARRSPLPKVSAADSGALAFSLARFSDHGRRWFDQNSWRRMLARPDLHVLSLRNSADREPDQPLSAFRAAMVS